MVYNAAEESLLLSASNQFPDNTNRAKEPWKDLHGSVTPATCLRVCLDIYDQLLEVCTCALSRPQQQKITADFCALCTRLWRAGRLWCLSLNVPRAGLVGKGRVDPFPAAADCSEVCEREHGVSWRWLNHCRCRWYFSFPIDWCSRSDWTNRCTSLLQSLSVIRRAHRCGVPSEALILTSVRTFGRVL